MYSAEQGYHIVSASRNFLIWSAGWLTTEAWVTLCNDKLDQPRAEWVIIWVWDNDWSQEPEEIVWQYVTKLRSQGMQLQIFLAILHENASSSCHKCHNIYWTVSKTIFPTGNIFKEWNWKLFFSLCNFGYKIWIFQKTACNFPFCSFMFNFWLRSEYYH